MSAPSPISPYTIALPDISRSPPKRSQNKRLRTDTLGKRQLQYQQSQRPQPQFHNYSYAERELRQPGLPQSNAPTQRSTSIQSRSYFRRNADDYDDDDTDIELPLGRGKYTQRDQRSATPDPVASLVYYELSSERARNMLASEGASKPEQNLRPSPRERDPELDRGFKLVPVKPTVPARSAAQDEQLELVVAEAARWEKLWCRSLRSFVLTPEQEKFIDTALLEAHGFRLNLGSPSGSPTKRSLTVGENASHCERGTPTTSEIGAGSNSGPVFLTETEAINDPTAKIHRDMARVQEIVQTVNGLLQKAGIPTSIKSFQEHPDSSRLLSAALVEQQNSGFGGLRHSRSPSASGLDPEYAMITDILADMADELKRTKGPLILSTGQHSTAPAKQSVYHSSTPQPVSPSPSPVPEVSALPLQVSPQPGLDAGQRIVNTSRGSTTMRQSFARLSSSAGTPNIGSATIHQTMRRYHLPPIKVTRQLPRNVTDRTGRRLAALQERAFDRDPSTLTATTSSRTEVSRLAEDEDSDEMTETKLESSTPLDELIQSIPAEAAPWLTLGLDVGAETPANIEAHIKSQQNMWEQIAKNNQLADEAAAEIRRLRTLRCMLELLHFDLAEVRSQIEATNQLSRAQRDAEYDSSRHQERQATESLAMADAQKLVELNLLEKDEVYNQIWLWMKVHRPGLTRQLKQGQHRKAVEALLKRELSDNEENESDGRADLNVGPLRPSTRTHKLNSSRAVQDSRTEAHEAPEQEPQNPTSQITPHKQPHENEAY